MGNIMKENLDGSINGVHQSEHAKLMNEFFNGDVLQKHSGCIPCLMMDLPRVQMELTA